MPSFTRSLVAASIVVVSITAAAQAVPLVQWTFEGTAANNLSPTVSGTTGLTQPTLPAVAPEINPNNIAAAMTSVHTNAAKFYTGNGNGSATGFFSNAWTVGDYNQLTADLTGYDTIVLSIDAAGSATGPANFTAQYTLNGTDYIDFASYNTPTIGGATANFSTATNNPAFHLDLPLPANISNVQGFRLVDASTTSVANGTVGAGGTNRLDNLTISGNVIGATTPEPASLAAIASASALLVRRGRRAAR